MIELSSKRLIIEEESSSNITPSNIPIITRDMGRREEAEIVEVGREFEEGRKRRRRRK